MGFLMNLKRKAQGEAHLRVIFHGGPPYDRIAFNMLKWTIEDRGLEQQMKSCDPHKWSPTNTLG